MSRYEWYFLLACWTLTGVFTLMTVWNIHLVRGYERRMAEYDRIDAENCSNHSNKGYEDGTG